MRSLYFIALVIFSQAAFSAPERVEGIVAIVNTEVITDSDLRTFEKKLKNNGIIDDLLLMGKTTDQLKGDRKAQLDYLVSEKILESEIKRNNLTVTVERVEQELRDTAKRNGISRAELPNVIRSQGLVFSDYQDFIKTRIERQSLIEQEITSKIRVSDEDVLAEYVRQNPNAGSGLYEYTVAHILFNPKKGGPAAAEERARNVAQKLKAGANFDAIAEQHSEDTNFTTGGLLGTFKAGEMAPEMEQAVSKLEVGGTSGVVKSRMGLHVLKLVSKRVVADPRFDKEKEKIRNQLVEKVFQKQLRNWLETKREESFIRINS